MITNDASSADNELLLALPSQERVRIMDNCVCVPLTQDQVLSEPGQHLEFVYFPIDAFISVLAVTDSVDALGLGIIGSNDMLGTTLLLGLTTSPFLAQVHGAGTALRMSVADFQAALPEMPALERLLQLNLYVQLKQFAQTAACTAFHMVERRLAYLLLLTHDRSHGDRFYMTHEHLARLLGVRRSGVTTAAGVLHQRKLITYSRGHIRILNRKGLENAACSCYEVVSRTISDIAAPGLHVEAHVRRALAVDTNGDRHPVRLKTAILPQAPLRQ